MRRDAHDTKWPPGVRITKRPDRLEAISMTVNTSLADAGSLSSTFTGRVASVNPKGLKLEGHDTWANYSKFAVGIVAPERGDTVTVTVDKAGFVRSVTLLDGPPPVAGGSDVPAAPSVKDRTITRLAVLKAAAEFAAARPQLKSGDVLAIAESWERWALRSDDPADDLAEAF
ncbi:MAG TPA: hypothetical protein VIL10_05285 [Marmoricola sp.]